MHDDRHAYAIELVLLAVTVVAFLSFMVRSLLTGEDIPAGWGYLIGMSWGGLLGIREVFKRPGRGGDGHDRQSGPDR